MAKQLEIGADPMVMARRIEKLEGAITTLAATVEILANVVNVIGIHMDYALCEEKPERAAGIRDALDDIGDVYARVRRASGIARGQLDAAKGVRPW
jgi:hypothetical protein